MDTINLVPGDSNDRDKDASVGRELSAAGYNSRQEIRELNLASHCTPIIYHQVLDRIFGPTTSTFKYLKSKELLAAS